jgi:hypothetical protein
MRLSTQCSHGSGVHAAGIKRSQVIITHDLWVKHSIKERCAVKVRAMEGRAPQLPVTKYDVEVP